MTDIAALAVALLLSRLRDPYYLNGLHVRAAAKARDMLAQRPVSGGFAWALLVLAPFLGLLAVDAALSPSAALSFALSCAVALAAWKIQHHSYFLERIMRALYSNDVPQAEYLSRKWGGDPVSSTEDVLRLCANRLHNDIFLSMFWFGVFGPAGAYLGLAHRLLGGMAAIPPQVDRAVRLPAEAVSVLLTALAGNFGPAFGKIFSADAVGESMVQSSGLDPEDVDIERIPGYRRLVERVFWAQCAFTALLLLLLR